MHSGFISLASKPAGDSILGVQAELIVISGPSGAGKTTWCLKAAAQAKKDGLRIAGLVSPGIIQNEHKVGISVIDLATDEQRLFATRKNIDGNSDGCQWEFNEETITWANAALRRADAYDVIFIDELGPLELLHGGGFQAAIPLIDSGRYESAFVVIRPGLLTLARSRWPHMQAYQFKRILV